LYNVVHVVQESAGNGYYVMEKFGRGKEREITKT
jgi:hypothetical protein